MQSLFVILLLQVDKRQVTGTLAGLLQDLIKAIGHRLVTQVLLNGAHGSAVEELGHLQVVLLERLISLLPQDLKPVYSILCHNDVTKYSITTIPNTV